MSHKNKSQENGNHEDEHDESHIEYHNEGMVEDEDNDNDYMNASTANSIDDNVDGYDVLKVSGYKNGYVFEQSAGAVKMIDVDSSAKVEIKNVDMLSFDDGSNIIIAHSGTEGALARMFQAYLDRDATVNEWKLGVDALSYNVPVEDIFSWFNSAANLGGLNNTEYVQTVYSNLFSRQATNMELNYYVGKLANNETDRNWLVVELASSDEAIEVVGSVITIDSAL